MSKNREVFESIHSPFEGNTDINQKNQNVGIQKIFLPTLGIHYRPKCFFPKDMLQLIVETKFIAC